ncbi:hypothetical protein ACHAPJ_007711 [Fusarium lateritium]
MADTPPRLESLPPELICQIGDCITVSQLDGVTRASKLLRGAFARSMFYSVNFSGDQKKLSRMLAYFLLISSRKGTKETIKCMRHVSVIVGHGEEGHDSARALGRLIISVLGKISGLSALNLDVWRLSRAKQRQMRRQLKLTPPWSDLQSLRIDAGLKILKSLFIKIPFGSLKAMHLGQGINCPHLKIVKERYPQVKKLSLLLYQPPSEQTGASTYAAEDQSDSIGQSIRNNFEDLQWLVLTQL